MESGGAACGSRSRCRERRVLMHGGMGAMVGTMMAGLGLVWILVIAVVVLGIVALLKYVLKN